MKSRGEKRPDLRAFWEETALPAAVRGPVDMIFVDPFRVKGNSGLRNTMSVVAVCCSGCGKQRSKISAIGNEDVRRIAGKSFPIRFAAPGMIAAKGGDEIDGCL